MFKNNSENSTAVLTNNNHEKFLETLKNLVGLRPITLSTGKYFCTGII